MSTQHAAIATLKDGITNQPRSLQKTIGPSELGTDCDHCLAAKLAGWQQKRDADWLPFIGTSVHAQAAEIFEAAGDRWLVETPVMVGWVGDAEVWGSSDLFDVQEGTVVDWKVVGPTTITAAKRGPSPVYYRQINLYGLGFRNAGHDVKKVAICYLPRNAVSLAQAVWWEDHFDPAAAQQTLGRANQIVDQINMLRTVDPAAVDVWIAGLPRADRCYDCARFADAPAHISSLASLVA
ncbi:hypothetical protein [Microbacterium sp. PA5]|uniref:hypothetical protein n=1 Tax=Microbacterium sp. PA5 TaxID=3416654 RepID=UPI003CF29077